MNFKLYKREQQPRYYDIYGIKVNQFFTVFSFKDPVFRVYEVDQPYIQEEEEESAILTHYGIAKYTKIKDDFIPKPPRMKSTEFGNNTRQERKNTNHFLKAIRNHYPEYCL